MSPLPAADVTIAGDSFSEEKRTLLRRALFSSGRSGTSVKHQSKNPLLEHDVCIGRFRQPTRNRPPFRSGVFVVSSLLLLSLGTVENALGRQSPKKCLFTLPPFGAAAESNLFTERKYSVSVWYFVWLQEEPDSGRSGALCGFQAAFGASRKLLSQESRERSEEDSCVHSAARTESRTELLVKKPTKKHQSEVLHRQRRVF